MKYSVKFLPFILALGMLACSEKMSEEEMFQKASKFAEEENYDEAIHGYEKQVMQYPRGKRADEALERAAFLYYNNIHDFHKAIDLHEQLIQNYPESDYLARARFMVGFIYANDLHDYDEAEKSYREFLEYHADNELAESVRWELEHLGQDVSEQLLNAFESESDGATHTN